MKRDTAATVLNATAQSAGPVAPRIAMTTVGKTRIRKGDVPASCSRDAVSVARVMVAFTGRPA